MTDRSPIDRWENPLNTRYASPEMSHLFSARQKFTNWRKLWLWLAEAEKELGLPIPEVSLQQLRAHLVPTEDEIAAADRYERETKHDVMAHLHALGDVAPAARGVLHLGATSAFVGDNADLITLREALRLLTKRSVRVIARLARFARSYRDLPCLGFTHFQAAQPTTVGKRACLWLQDLALDHRELTRRADELRFLGCKGATGTQASFVALFDGDADKAERLDRLVAQKAGFSDRLLISGQTYTRKQDAFVLSSLAGVGSSASKFANDIRLLQHMKEIEEPFGKKQVGSSAMPYKRNPMKCERINALSRWILSIADSGNWTHATQWFERTLDDSANRRLALAEAFLAADAVLLLWDAVADGLVVHSTVVRRRLDEELPFLVTENILMAATKKGGDRQVLHERLRVLAQAAGDKLKDQGGANDLLLRIASDPAFHLGPAELEAAADPARFIGRAPEQVDEFLQTEIEPILATNPDAAREESAEVAV
ncbi:MAG TPA: adenylosuccinate lyase [Thermoanaerobaculia bacterium]|nr:adenylosuccinate lyase [Thermoanaerobaculia bacterium]